MEVVFSYQLIREPTAFQPYGVHSAFIPWRLRRADGSSVGSNNDSLAHAEPLCRWDEMGLEMPSILASQGSRWPHVGHVSKDGLGKALNSCPTRKQGDHQRRD